MFKVIPGSKFSICGSLRHGILIQLLPKGLFIFLDLREERKDQMGEPSERASIQIFLSP